MIHLKEYKNYNPIFEERSEDEIMFLFDKITNYLPVRRVKGFFIDWSIYKSETIKKIVFQFSNINFREPLNVFMECLAPYSYFSLINSMNNRLEFNLKENITEIKIENVTYEKSILICDVPLHYTVQECLDAMKKLLIEWISLFDIKGEEPYKTEFLKWWFTTYLFQPKGNEFPSAFETALVEWMKIAKIEDAKKAYLDLVNNLKDKNNIKWATRLKTEEIIEYVDWGIREFKIPIEDLQKGSKIISRFQ